MFFFGGRGALKGSLKDSIWDLQIYVYIIRTVSLVDRTSYPFALAPVGFPSFKPNRRTTGTFIMMGLLGNLGILDVSCGFGLSSIAAALSGHNVTATEMSHQLLRPAPKSPKP